MHITLDNGLRSQGITLVENLLPCCCCTTILSTALEMLVQYRITGLPVVTPDDKVVSAV
jgi:CBS domain-containing protein